PRPCGGPPRPCWARTACLAPGLPGAARAASSSAAPRAEEAAPAGAAPKSLEERVGALEEAQRALEVRIAEVEKLAKRKGMWQMVMQYGLGQVWGSSLFGIYMLLEMEVVSWQDSLLPLLERAGMEGYAERVDPTMGNLIIAFIVNECVEPIRFPFVIATGAPVVNAFRRLRQGKAGPGSAQSKGMEETDCGQERRGMKTRGGGYHGHGHEVSLGLIEPSFEHLHRAMICEPLFRAPPWKGVRCLLHSVPIEVVSTLLQFVVHRRFLGRASFHIPPCLMSGGCVALVLLSSGLDESVVSVMRPYSILDMFCVCSVFGFQGRGMFNNMGRDGKLILEEAAGARNRFMQDLSPSCQLGGGGTFGG
ncbi:unnamed protein product, partial [Prorocentrum cordatum]